MTRCTTAGVSPVEGNKRRERFVRFLIFMLEWTALDVKSSCGCGVSEYVPKQGNPVGA